MTETTLRSAPLLLVGALCLAVGCADLDTGPDLSSSQGAQNFVESNPEVQQELQSHTGGASAEAALAQTITGFEDEEFLAAGFAYDSTNSAGDPLVCAAGILWLYDANGRINLFAPAATLPLDPECGPPVSAIGAGIRVQTESATTPGEFDVFDIGAGGVVYGDWLILGAATSEGQWLVVPVYLPFFE